MEPDQALREEARWSAQGLHNTPPQGLTTSMIQTRLITYRPQTAPHQYQCPRCWMRQAVNMSLRSVPGTDEYDVLRCNDSRCGAEFIVPF